MSQLGWLSHIYPYIMEKKQCLKPPTCQWFIIILPWTGTCDVDESEKGTTRVHKWNQKDWEWWWNLPRCIPLYSSISPKIGDTSWYIHDKSPLFLRLNPPWKAIKKPKRTPPTFLYESPSIKCSAQALLWNLDSAQGNSCYELGYNWLSNKM